MGRWEPNPRERLQEAAMQLYAERGFAETAVADIAERAGLTERTFFRYFADKREVLFWGAPRLQQLLVDTLLQTPASTGALEAVATALAATGPMFSERLVFARQRHALICAHAELLERELIKLATLAAAMAQALCERGVPRPEATLAAETGVVVFKMAFERWVGEDSRLGLEEHIQALFAELAALHR